MLSEVKAVTLGVSNLQRACSFYRDALGYQIQAQGEISADLAGLWRFDPALKGQYAMLPRPDGHDLPGRLHLHDLA